MASRFSIEAVFKAVDKITAPITRMGNRVSKSFRKIGSAVDRASTRFRKFGKSLGPVLGVAGVAGALLAVKMALGAVITTGAEFEQTLVGAGARFEQPIRRATAAFKELSDLARKIGRTTEFTANQAAGGLNFMAKAGFSADQAIALLPGLVDLATASELDLARATDIASDSIGAFGLQTEDAAQLGLNFGRVSDQMAKTVNSTNTNMEQLFETVKKGAPAFIQTGQSMSTFLALTGRLAQSGLKASEAGTAIKNIGLKLADIGVQRSLRRMNVFVKDLDTGKARDFADVMDDLGEALSGKTKIERAGILNQLFGLRGVTGVSLLLGEGTTALRALRKELENSTGETGRLAAVMRDTLRGQIKELNSAVESLGLTFFSANQEGIEAFTEGLTGAVRSIEGLLSPDISKAALNLGALATAFLGVGLAIGAIGAAITFIVGSPVALAGALIALGAGFVRSLVEGGAFGPIVRGEAREVLPALDIITPEQRLQQLLEGGSTRNEIAMTIRGDRNLFDVEPFGNIPGFELDLEDTGALA